MHKRAEIKTKVVEMLQSGFSPNVYKARYLPIGKNSFPAASVYCPEDLSEKAKSNEHYDRTANLIIILYSKGYDASEDGEDTSQRDIDSELDDLTETVEDIFFASIQTLKGTVFQMNLTKTTYMVDAKTEDIIGIAKMEWDVEYKDLVL